MAEVSNLLYSFAYRSIAIDADARLRGCVASSPTSLATNGWIAVKEDVKAQTSKSPHVALVVIRGFERAH